ncbi:hypothetical protein DOC35_19460 [Salmonella enterica subsp. enterica]|nr:hypothetical protein [Salmonella enterica subsp. enterica]
MTTVKRFAALVALLGAAIAAPAHAAPQFKYVDCADFAEGYSERFDHLLEKKPDDTKGMYKFLCGKAVRAALSNYVGAEDYAKYIAADRETNIKGRLERGASERDAKIYVSLWEQLMLEVFSWVRGNQPAAPVVMDCKQAAYDQYHRAGSPYKNYSFSGRMTAEEAGRYFATQCEEGLKAAKNWNKTNWQIGRAIKPVYEARKVQLAARGWSEKEASAAASQEIIGFIAGFEAARGSTLKEIDE